MLEDDAQTNGVLIASQHLVGALCLCAAIGVLLLIPLLPARSASALEMPFTTSASTEILVLYAGFPGCATTCPAALATIGHAFRSDLPAHIQLAFLNVHRNSRAETVLAYARAHHPSFTATTLNDRTSAWFRRHLGLESYDSAQAALAHANNLYILKRQQDGWRLVDIVRRTPTPSAFRKRVLSHSATSTG